MRLFILLVVLMISACEQQKDGSKFYREVDTESAKALALYIPDQKKSDSSTKVDPHSSFRKLNKSPSLVPPDMTKSASTFKWATPDSWEEKKSDGFRLASFVKKNQLGSMLCTLIPLRGDGGGIKANLQRWISQLNLRSNDLQIKQLMENKQKVQTSDQLEISIFDLTPLSQMGNVKESMIIAVLPVDNKTLFIKMTGSIEMLKAEKNRFVKLCSSLKKAKPQSTSP